MAKLQMDRIQTKARRGDLHDIEALQPSTFPTLSPCGWQSENPSLAELLDIVLGSVIEKLQRDMLAGGT